LEVKYRGTDKPHDRMAPAPVSLSDLGGVDFVLSTHRHTDHMDGETLRAVAEQNPACQFVIPVSELEHARSLGLPRERMITLDAGESVSLPPGLEVRAVRAAHETLQTNGKGQHHFLGYILRWPETAVYHSGDTVWFEGLTEEVKGQGINLALLPVNGRGKGVAGNFTFDEAVEFCRAAGIPEMVPQHFGMFAFNTVDRAVLESAAAEVTDPVCHLPDFQTALQFNPTKP